jgi:hypothetical protein
VLTFGYNIIQKYSNFFEVNLITLCHFPDDMFHVSEFHGKDTGVLKLDVVTHVYAVPGH